MAGEIAMEKELPRLFISEIVEDAKKRIAVSGGPGSGPPKGTGGASSAVRGRNK
ncbi:MAG: hypothetical protein MMC33_010544, partial [Icmadophila ericetorum]|nr:hypothetical protein [Icmadophila ericetorum]